MKKKFDVKQFLGMGSSKRTVAPAKTEKITPPNYTQPPFKKIEPTVILHEAKKMPNQPVVDSRREFLRVFKQLTCRHRPWNVWQDFIIMFACAISNSLDKSNYDEREALYMRTIQKYDREEQMLFPELTAHTVLALENNSEQDFLGGIFMELDLGNDHAGQFFTPYSVCQTMAEITMTTTVEQVLKEGYITINDCACGAGATLIAGIQASRKQLEKENLNFQYHVLVTAQDVDFVVGLMCYIQISLLGVAGFVKIGNTLTDPMSSNDTVENYWFTPMYYSDTWVIRRLFRNLGKENCEHG